MNDHKEQLLNNIEKRFKTTMIGALARFEESFGYLWEDDSSQRLMFEKRIRLSKSCADCTFEEQEKCTKAFMTANHEHFVHCNTSNCKLLKDLGL
jgi:hypothetical protein